MSSLGIMQGRLTPMKGRGIQFFPFDEWEEEFYLAKELRLNEIEWIFDYEMYDKNPLWTSNGRSKIKEVIKENGVKVNSVCWDYFMRRPCYKYSEKEYEDVFRENISFFRKTITAMKEIGAGLIEIPMVDNSSVKSDYEKIRAMELIRQFCDIAKELNIRVGLETDFPPIEFRNFLDEMGKENLAANYDSGNSSGLGYHHEKEIISLNDKIFNVHIKDRICGGGTVKLGTGNADFEQIFESLKRIGYKNSFILQAARGEEEQEKETIEAQIKFVKKYIEKYKIDNKE